MVSIFSIFVTLLLELNSMVANVDKSLIGIKFSAKIDFLKTFSVLQVSNYENLLVEVFAKSFLNIYWD